MSAGPGEGLEAGRATGSSPGERPRGIAQARREGFAFPRTLPAREEINRRDPRERGRGRGWPAVPGTAGGGGGGGAGNGPS